MRIAIANDSLVQATHTGRLGWLQAPLFVASRPMLMAAAATGFLAVIVSILGIGTYRKNIELDKLRTAAQTWQRQYESARQANTELQAQLQLSRQAAPGSGKDGSGPLPILASVFNLDRTRSADSNSSESVNRIVISRLPQWIVLILDGEEDQNVRSYRVTLTDSQGKPVWNKSLVSSSASNTLSVTLPATLLHQGAYRLTLEGRTGQDAYLISGRYSFRVIFKP